MPIALSIDEAPFATLLRSRLAVLKLSGFVKVGLDDPFLPLVDKAPFAGLRLHRGKSFAELSDVAVLGAGRAAGAKAGNKKRGCARAKSVFHEWCVGVRLKPAARMSAGGGALFARRVVTTTAARWAACLAWAVFKVCVHVVLQVPE